MSAQRKLLSEFSTEELREELRRRRKKSKKATPEFLEWEGIVEQVHEWGKLGQYQYTVFSNDPKLRLHPMFQRTRYNLKTGAFNKKNTPKIGDRVRMCLRYTKKMKLGKEIIYWNLGKIKEVIK